MNTITVACGQFDVKFGDKAYNAAKMKSMAESAKREYGADLIVFPECAVAGYRFTSLEEAKEYAEPVPGPFSDGMLLIAKELDISILYGLIESDGECCYNTAVICEPDGNIVKYRKTHMPFMGVDKFLDKGAQLRISNTRFGPVGMLICYDLRFPEAARSYALDGARMIIQPTNLPEGAEILPEIFTRTRACENKTFIISCNRCGQERGARFFGRSQIVDVSGDVLAELGDGEGIISAAIDLSRAEEKDRIVIPGEYETYLFRDRRPELYGSLIESERV